MRYEAITETELKARAFQTIAEFVHARLDGLTDMADDEWYIMGVVGSTEKLCRALFPENDGGGE